MSLVELIFFLVSAFIITFYALFYAYYLFLFLVSLYGIWAQPRWSRLLVPEQLLESYMTPPVTLVVPAYNETATIVESVHALLGLQYPRLEVIVINDGSTDDTLGELIRSFSLRRADVAYHARLPTERVRGIYVSTLERRLMVIDKVNGGKSDALNAGINVPHAGRGVPPGH